jgi:hypothetical protein
MLDYIAHMLNHDYRTAIRRQLVRCRDCMFYDELIGRFINFDGETVSEDSFCSEAEPKEDKDGSD